MNRQAFTIIGRAERVDLPGLGYMRVPAKIDTGADLSAIWASRVEEQEDGLHCVFFGPESEFYTGEEVIFPKKTYTRTRVANSFGHRELRYKVKLSVDVKGRSINATFTLSDRSLKIYPVLLGRRMLAKKFLVDVATGEPLLEEERRRKTKLLLELEQDTE